MRPILSLVLLLPATLGGAGLVGCGTAQAPASEEAVLVETTPPPLDRFSAQRAWQDLEVLASSPRVSGSAGSARAREYLRVELRKLGLEVTEIQTTRSVEGLPDVTLHHLTARLPGASPRTFLLVAPYDSSRFSEFEFVGANDGASGAAVLLELARVLSTRSLPYSVQLLFLDGEGRAAGGAEGPAAARWYGSAAVAEQMRQSGELERIGLLVAFHQVCDADLRIARDLTSHRMYREEFFRAAQRVGRSHAFSTDLGFESATASHTAFRERGVRPVVVLTDTRYGGSEVPGVYAESPEDTLAHCSSESLETVGVVTLEALDTIAQRLEKIDRFTRSPLSVPEPAEVDVESAAIGPSAPSEPSSADPAATPAGEAAPAP